MVTVEIYEFVRLFFEVPIYHLILEAVLIFWVLSLILKRTNKSSKSSLSEKASLWNRLSENEREELIQEWTPEPLVPDDADQNPIKYDVIQGKVGKHVTIAGHQYLNAATHNFLGMVGDERVEAAAVRCLRKYGVGSCGPRAFYGTIDVHLDLEKRVTQFLHTEEAVLYSLGFSTVASAIPAYAKRSDVIFADEAVCFAIQKGLQASRSDVRYFRHNDTAHLEQLLEEHVQAGRKKPKQAALVRKFLVVEGIYTNTGTVCPLPELLRLKEAHKLRLFVDESLSFGVLGATGRGITEHFGVTTRDVDLISVSMEASLGSVGGFTTGSFYVADHQRLSGQGYVFSAALAPLCAAAAMCAIDLLDEQPEMMTKLRSVCRAMHQALGNIDGLELSGDEVSPVKFLQLSEPRPERAKTEAVLQGIVDQCRESGIALTRARYLESEEHRLPPPAIRVTCSRLMEPEDVRDIEAALTRAAGYTIG